MNCGFQSDSCGSRSAKNQENQKFNRFLKEMNRLFLALLLLFALAFGLAFIADVQGVFSIPDDPIAYVESSSGTVKRLGHQKLTWDRASNGSLFAAKDTIQTGEDSSVKIVFYAGGEMELGPGAMVALGGSLEEVQLNL